MYLEKADGEWIQVRTGYISMRIAGLVKLSGQDIQTKLTAAIKKIRIWGNENEEMELEEDAIKGLVNLVVKKNLKPKVEPTNDLIK